MSIKTIDSKRLQCIHDNCNIHMASLCKQSVLGFKTCSTFTYWHCTSCMSLFFPLMSLLIFQSVQAERLGLQIMILLGESLISLASVDLQRDLTFYGYMVPFLWFNTRFDLHIYLLGSSYMLGICIAKYLLRCTARASHAPCCQVWVSFVVHCIVNRFVGEKPLQAGSSFFHITL